MAISYIFKSLKFQSFGTLFLGFVDITVGLRYNAKYLEGLAIQYIH